MAAVRALPVDLLRALQEAELCDPGILLAYPRGSAESLGLAPQSPGRRIVSKSQGAQSRPDPTLIDGMHATGIDTGTGGIVSYPIVSIVSYIQLAAGFRPLRLFQALFLLSPCLKRVCREDQRT